MEVPRLGNFTVAQKQTTEKNEASKDARSLVSAVPQGKNIEEELTSYIPPVNQTAKLSGEEGNITNPESNSGVAVNLLA